MTVEEAGPSPEGLAGAIHAQLGPGVGAVPVHAVARALDIIDIREERLRSFEGAVLMRPDRDVGAILVNASSPPSRRRFTIAHELGHFLNLWHNQTSESGFHCTSADLRTPWRGLKPDEGRHRLQESQANRFAIELLAPVLRMRPFLKGLPDLEQVLALADALDLSREAAARRYVEKHDRAAALVFGAGDRIRYVERRGDFPFVVRGRHEPLLRPSAKADAHGLTGHVVVDWSDWLARPVKTDLLAQTLFQANGYSMTLLLIDDENASDEAD